MSSYLTALCLHPDDFTAFLFPVDESLFPARLGKVWQCTRTCGSRSLAGTVAAFCRRILGGYNSDCRSGRCNFHSNGSDREEARTAASTETRWPSIMKQLRRWRNATVPLQVGMYTFSRLSRKTGVVVRTTCGHAIICILHVR